MRITDIFRKQRRTFSFEFFPPKKYLTAVKFGINVGQLMKLQPSYVTVTYGAGGGTQGNTFDLVDLFQNKLDLTCMAHYTCVNATREKIAYDMRVLQDMGVENVMLIRGDQPKDQPNAFPNSDGFNYGSDLIKFVAGNYDFCIGAGAYPEKHKEAPSFEKDLDNLKRKVDSGADFLVTQMFFDNRYYWDFMNRVRKKGINLRVIPGVIPITNYRQIKKFAELSGAHIPEELQKRMEAHQDHPDAVYRIGLEYAVEQSQDLLSNDAPGLHIYTLNKSRAAIDLYESLAEEFKDVKKDFEKSFHPHFPKYPI
ncbi:MAG TPA: methylenetetrahydrofolate reductase [NAD(P)H] [Bacteroidales bacterium]|nr:methylenetetrahydrofolate reductase [NAD(P)H] [Bacteroidales bacterium]